MLDGKTLDSRSTGSPCLTLYKQGGDEALLSSVSELSSLSDDRRLRGNVGSELAAKFGRRRSSVIASVFGATGAPYNAPSALNKGSDLASMSYGAKGIEFGSTTHGAKGSDYATLFGTDVSAYAST